MNTIQQDIVFAFCLVGKPWVPGTSGPESFDCWGLVRFMFQFRRGITLPDYPDAWNAGLVATIKAAEREAASWEESDTPSHFSAVAMGRARRVEHVGLWIGDPSGAILHATEAAGVVYQTPLSIRSTGIQHFRYYNFRP